MAVKYNFEERESSFLKDIEQHLDMNYKKQLENELKFDKRTFIISLGTEIYDSEEFKESKQWEKDKEEVIFKSGERECDKIVEQVQNILDSGCERERIREFKNNTITQGIRLKLLQYLNEKEGQKSYKLEKTDVFMFLALLRKSKNNCEKRFEQFMKNRGNQYLDYISHEQNTEIKNKIINYGSHESEFESFLSMVTACVLKWTEKNLPDNLSENTDQFIKKYIEKCRKCFTMLLMEKEKLYSKDALLVRLAISGKKSVLYSQIEQAENEMLITLIQEWKERAEQERQFADVRKILLCETNEMENIKRKCIDKLKIQYRNWSDTRILEEYLDFLCKKIFVNENFWEYVYKRGEDIKQEYYDYCLNRKIEKDFPSLLQYSIATEIEWFCPNKAEDVFIENFKKHSYFRCFRCAYNEFYDAASQAQDFLNLDVKKKQAKSTLEDKIGNVFREWVSGLNWACFGHSILKDILYTILEKTKIKKTNCVKVYYSKDDRCWYKDGNVRSRVWNISANYASVNEHLMNQYFTYAYQIIKQYGIKEKSLHFDILVDNALEVDQQVDYFESYKLEEKNQIYTSWKLYSLVCEFVQADSQNKELTSAIEKLAKSLKSICNLELRLYVLFELQPIFREIKDNRHIEVVGTISEIAEIIKRNADEVGSLYMKIYRSLLWLFRKEDDWKNLLWLRNQEMESFSALKKEIQDLMEAVKDQKENKSYCEMKFWSLYEKKPTNPPYSEYSKILKCLQTTN